MARQSSDKFSRWQWSLAALYLIAFAICVYYRIEINDFLVSLLPL